MRPLFSDFADSTLEPYLYVFGGDRSRTDVYRVLQGKITWINSGPEMNPYFKFQGYTNMGSDILMVAGKKCIGRSIYPVNSCVIRYNTKEKTFISLPKFKFLRDVPTVFAILSHLYVTGGKERDLKMHVLDLNNKKGIWQISNVSLPFPVMFTQAIVINNTAYICSSGGNLTYTTKKRTSVIMWTPGMAAWKSLPHLNIPRKLHCTVTGEELGRNYIRKNKSLDYQLLCQ